jgi:hypothetical protein
MGLEAGMEQMEHGDRPTCGEGLAANSILPAKLAELMAAQAEVLERHTRALDPTRPRKKNSTPTQSWSAPTATWPANSLILPKKWLATASYRWVGTT